MSDDQSANEKRETAARFGRVATEYPESDAHRRGDDLTTLAGWCADADRTLDIAAIARVLAPGGTFAFGPDGVESFVVPERLFRLYTRTSGRPAGSEHTTERRM